MLALERIHNISQDCCAKTRTQMDSLFFDSAQRRDGKARPVYRVRYGSCSIPVNK